MVTLIKPEIMSENTVTVGDATVTFDPKICEVVISSKPRTPSGTFWFIDFNLKDGAREFEATIN